MKYHKLPPLNAIKVFDAVVRFGSISEAARQLRISQSSASKHIKNLEDFFKCKLLDRNSSGVILTKDGVEFNGRTREALSLIADITNKFQEKLSNIQTIKINSLSSFALRWLAPRIHNFQTQNPTIAIEVSISEDMPNFSRGQVDGAIISALIPPLDTIATELFYEKLIIVCSPSLRSEFSCTDPKNICLDSIINITSRPEIWQNWATHYKVKNAMQISMGLAFQDFYIAIAAAISGSGIALVPSFLVRSELETGSLIQPIQAPLVTGKIYQFVLPSSQKQNPAAVTLRDWLRKETVIEKKLT